MCLFCLYDLIIGSEFIEIQFHKEYTKDNDGYLEKTRPSNPGKATSLG